MKNKQNIIIIVLIFIIIYLANIIIRLENYHYAVQVGFCADISQLEKDKCLNKAQTRTNPLWHLFYALK